MPLHAILGSTQSWLMSGVLLFRSKGHSSIPFHPNSSLILESPLSLHANVAPVSPSSLKGKVFFFRSFAICFTTCWQVSQPGERMAVEEGEGVTYIAYTWETLQPQHPVIVLQKTLRSTIYPSEPKDSHYSKLHWVCCSTVFLSSDPFIPLSWWLNPLGIGSTNVHTMETH